MSWGLPAKYMQEARRRLSSGGRRVHGGGRPGGAPRLRHCCALPRPPLACSPKGGGQPSGHLLPSAAVELEQPARHVARPSQGVIGHGIAARDVGEGGRARTGPTLRGSAPVRPAHASYGSGKHAEAMANGRGACRNDRNSAAARMAAHASRACASAAGQHALPGPSACASTPSSH